MKKSLILLAVVALLPITTGAVDAPPTPWPTPSEVVPIPFFQHGWGCVTSFHMTNAQPLGGNDALVQFRLYDPEGNWIASPLGPWTSIAPQTSWQPTTGVWDPESWWQVQATCPNKTAIGFGRFEISTDSDCVQLWALISSPLSGGGTAGYTIVYPRGLYGAGGS